jgi:hypothetical protein
MEESDLVELEEFEEDEDEEESEDKEEPEDETLFGFGENDEMIGIYNNEEEQ